MTATLTTDDVQHRIDGRAAKMLLAIAQWRAMLSKGDGVEVVFDLRGDDVEMRIRGVELRTKQRY